MVFPDGKRVQFTVAELRIFTRRAGGPGGMQTFLRSMIPRVTSDRWLSLTALEVQRARDYLAKYGQGGYQDRFQVLVAAIERA